MQTAPPLLSFLLILLYQSGWTHGLCSLDNGTAARCHELEDLKLIDTQHLEFLKVSVARDTLAPGQFSGLENLKHLDLSNGDLREIEPGSLRTLSDLKNLNLADNHIEYLELASLDGLIHLRSLNLRKNSIRQLPPALTRLKSLRHLDIYGNPLECNCATLKVRDLIVQRGVTIPKKIVCAGPGNTKGTPLLKPNASIVCSFEQQDREMQNDQAHEGSGTNLEYEDGLDELNEAEEEEKEKEKDEEKVEKEEEDEDEGEEEEQGEKDDKDDKYVEVGNGTSEKPKEPEIETPFPTEDSTTESSVIASSVLSRQTNVSTESSTLTNSLRRAGEDEEIFFDEEKKEHTSTTEVSRKQENFKDALFYPTWSSGDGEDGSGEGSGAALSHFDEEKTVKEDTNEESSFFSGSGLIDALFGLLGTTAPATKAKDAELEEEQFIDASSTEMTTKETFVPSQATEFDKTVTTIVPILVSISNNVELLKPAGTDDASKSDNVRAEVDSLNDEQSSMSPAKQSKKGMGSYVVLGILLAVVAGLIGFAAYKGRLCNKKRKRNDVETGTELKDMQKSLLPGPTGDSVQPKIASNGNAESVPLVEGDEDVKTDKIRSDGQPSLQEAPRPLNGTADHPDPVKPPRRLITQDEAQKNEERPRVDVNSLRENFLAGGTSPTQQSPEMIPAAVMNNGPTMHDIDSEPVNGPPLSPDAQRVKITLQENPDSVPKTPLLITRTMAGENLVKTP